MGKCLDGFQFRVLESQFVDAVQCQDTNISSYGRSDRPTVVSNHKYEDKDEPVLSRC